MTISDVIQSIAHNEYSLIILTRSDEYKRFMNDPIHLKRNEDHSAQMNFAEMIADDVKEGGAQTPRFRTRSVGLFGTASAVKHWYREKQVGIRII